MEGGLESWWDVLHVDDILDNFFVEVVYRHGNMFDKFRNRARGENADASMDALVDPDGLASIRYVQELSHFEEVDRSLCSGKCSVDLSISGTE